jgi:hypothetical protein
MNPSRTSQQPTTLHARRANSLLFLIILGAKGVRALAFITETSLRQWTMDLDLPFLIFPKILHKHHTSAAPTYSEPTKHREPVDPLPLQALKKTCHRCEIGLLPWTMKTCG